MADRANGANPYYSGDVTDHFDGQTFFNPNGLQPRSFGDFLKWQFGGNRAKWPAAFPSPHPRARPDPGVDDDRLRVTMVGHASLLIQAAGLNLLTDPVWSERVSPFSFIGPKRVNAPGIAFEDLPRIDAVLLTHNHYDHLDIATLQMLHDRHDPIVVTPLGNDAIVKKTVPTMRFACGDWGDSFTLSPEVRVHIEPAHHWSARGTGDRRMALWSAFAVEAPAGKIYIAGDTGFHDGINYRNAAEKHGGFRLAILPIGAYEPRWFMKGQHQNPDEAVRGMQLCGADFAAGCHWGTFQLTNEPIEEPRDLLYAALQRHGIADERFRAMLPGEIWDIPSATA